MSIVSRHRKRMSIITLIASIIALIGTIDIAQKVASSGSYGPYSFIYVDSLSAIVMMLIAVIGFFTTAYSFPYLGRERRKGLIGNTRIKKYFIQLNFFLAAMFISAASSSPVITWIFLEASTLSTAFLISYYDKPSTIEAAWKYLIINSTGLLLGFFGTLLYFAAFSQSDASGLITWQMLAAQASNLDPNLAKAAFVFVLIGYGTKLGLVPMHTWKPDTYSKSPAPIGALFSGALIPVALLAILKFKNITDTATGVSFTQNLLIAFGIASIVIAAFSMLTVKNYKRLLGYSSIEHAGIIVLGFGFGGIGVLAAILHTIYHSLLKSSLFFTSGNILLKYHSARIKNVKGLINTLPVTGTLFFISFIAVTGLPPFGIFLTEIATISAGAKSYLYISILVVLSLALVFVGFFKYVVAMVFGQSDEKVKPGDENVWLIIPPLGLILMAIVLSFYIPPFLQTLIQDAVVKY